MRAMVLTGVGALEDEAAPLEPRELPTPEPAAGEVRLAVSACGVCHTELDEIEGRAAPPVLPVVPGHEVVGRVDAVGEAVTAHRLGDRVGVGWIHESTGEADENLSPAFRGTGRDVNGGYAQYMTVPERYAYPIPDRFTDVEAAPLLCAGAIGYRALRLTGVGDGARLGLTGFGASGHLVCQLARHLFPETDIFVFARDPGQRAHATSLGAAWTGDIGDRPPQQPDAIVDTTPVWRPAVEALASLRPGGRLVINAIRKEDADKESLLSLSYPDHLWWEKEIKTVANITHHDIAAFLPIAADAEIHPQVTTHRLEEANEALTALKRGSGRGAKVLVV